MYYIKENQGIKINIFEIYIFNFNEKKCLFNRILFIILKIKKYMINIIQNE